MFSPWQVLVWLPIGSSVTCSVALRNLALHRWFGHQTGICLWFCGVSLLHLKSPSDKQLTWKTCFLLTPAPVKRVCELHSLSYRVRQFLCLADFVAKTQNPLVPDDFMDGNREKILLCPIRALSKYSVRTEQYRPDISGLFVSTFHTKKRVSQNIICLLALTGHQPHICVSFWWGLSRSAGQGSWSLKGHYFFIVSEELCSPSDTEGWTFIFPFYLFLLYL